MASETSLVFFLVMKWSVWLLLINSEIFFLRTAKVVFFFSIWRSFLECSSLRTFRWSVRRNYLVLVNDLSLMFFLTTLLTVATDTLRSFVIFLIDLIEFLSIWLLTALTSLGITTEGFFPDPGIQLTFLFF